MQMVEVKNRIAEVREAQKVADAPAAHALTILLYRDVLEAIAGGSARMPAHLAREALKVETEETERP